MHRELCDLGSQMLIRILPKDHTLRFLSSTPQYFFLVYSNLQQPLGHSPLINKALTSERVKVNLDQFCFPCSLYNKPGQTLLNGRWLR